MAKEKQAEQVRKNKDLRSIARRNVSGWALILPSIILFIMLIWRPIGIGYSFF